MSTLLLRQELAAEQVRWMLSQRGIPPTGARVAVSGARLTGQMARAVTELPLPAGADRGQLLAALREAGAIRAGVLSVGSR